MTIHPNPSFSDTPLFGAEDSSYPSVFLPVEFLIDIQH